MPMIPLHAPRVTRTSLGEDTSGSIPPLLKTPLGLALMELQGHINVPTSTESEGNVTPVGRLVFPDFNASGDGTPTEGPWMKKVYFYIGHQRMLGQVKKLAKPLAVVGRKNALGDRDGNEMSINGAGEELEILEIVRWKIVFNSRPEPVGEGEND